MEISNYMKSIPVNMPEKDILARLKFNIHRTRLSDDDRRRITLSMKRGFDLCRPAGMWLRLDISERSENSVLLEDGYELKGKSASGLLAMSRSVIIMAATVGQGIVDLASEAMSLGDGADALIYDAVGSETADGAMDWLNRFLGNEVRRRGERLTSMRFSPGYGDLSLENQVYFYEKLDMSRLGVRLSDKYIFSPEKTVTAIVGVE